MKAAIVGCGNIAAVHAKSISLLEGVELAAAADIKKDRAEKYEKEYGCRAYDSLESMLERSARTCFTSVRPITCMCPWRSMRCKEESMCSVKSRP